MVDIRPAVVRHMDFDFDTSVRRHNSSYRNQRVVPHMGFDHIRDKLEIDFEVVEDKRKTWR